MDFDQDNNVARISNSNLDMVLFSALECITTSTCSVLLREHVGKAYLRNPTLFWNCRDCISL